jgi:hypothetical protein
MASTVEVSCKWCECQFTARIADRARGWAKCCSKACAASLKSFGHNKVYWEKKNPDSHLSKRGCALSVQRGRDTDVDAHKFDPDDDDIDISDMDFGASDGGGYSNFDGSPT